MAERKVERMETVWVIYGIVDDPEREDYYSDLDMEYGAFKSAEEAKEKALEELQRRCPDGDIEVEVWTDKETGEVGYECTCGVVTVQALPLALH